MPWFTDDERALLARVLEIPPDNNRKGLPGLKPLSLYSSELKNLKQVAGVLSLAAAGQPLSEHPRTKDRYFNTLQTHGVIDADGTVSASNIGAQVVLQFRGQDDGTNDYWQRNADAVETPLFRNQINRLLTGAGGIVNDAWRKAFWHVQQILDHIPTMDLAPTLGDTDRLEILQYIHSVGTEPWRYFRLSPGDRTLIDALILRIRSEFDTATIDHSSLIEVAAKQYGNAIHAVQRDIRFRVAGFIRAFVSVRNEFGEKFPRAFPDLTLVAKETPALGAGTTSAPPPAFEDREPLGLPLQTIISGCPGSGKSYFTQAQLTPETIAIRSQFHAETSIFDFVGSYKPTPVYENTTNSLVDSVGETFEPGRPVIDYRFLPGPFANALVAAAKNPNRNVVLLIEEINRANAAAVFGELFQLLDRDESGHSRYGVSPQPEFVAFLRGQNVLDIGEQLRLPPNLHIWATMNSADQGVFPLDTAFRRRWSYRYLGYAEVCNYPVEARRLFIGDRLVDWDQLRGKINERLIGLGIHEDKLIGPYFLTKEQLSDSKEILNKLLLYLWDDVLRFRQQDLFNASSFSQVGLIWNGGVGLPLIGIDLPEDVTPELVHTEPDATFGDQVTDLTPSGSDEGS